MVNSIVGLFQETVAANESRPAARYKNADGQWETRTWAQLSADRKVVASGLISLGLQAHERVNILSNTSYKWVVADLGIQSVAGEPVAIYQSNLSHDVEYIVNNSDAVMIFAEDAEQLAKLVEERDKVDGLRKVIVMNDDSQSLLVAEGGTETAENSDWIISWTELLRLGQKNLVENESEINARISSLKLDDVHSVSYTSGTNGTPKGVVLTHANLIYECESLAKVQGMICADDVELLFLPLAYSFAKALECYWFFCGHEMAIESKFSQVVPNMAVVRPTVMCSVPRIFEKIYAKITNAGLDAPGVKGKIFAWALSLNNQYALCIQGGRDVPFALQFKLNIAKSLVFSRIGDELSDLFGGRLRCFVSGGALLSKKIAFFFHHSGVTILEGYGLTETSGATTINRADLNKIGTVGRPLDGTEIKIAEDGEILIRGGGVMREYWKGEEATQEVLTADGWFSTGDIGRIDKDGYLKITDRKKDTLLFL